MCGIFGHVDRAPAAEAGAGVPVARMRNALGHRGPDGWGLVTLDGHSIEERGSSRPPARRARRAPVSWTAALGHQRLAVIDLSDGGRQPRSTPDGRFWITYNGEIYNYQELRRELESVGLRFASQSDTEVLLCLFVREGPGCLGRLRGMFALAIWDDLEGTLFLARDRFGMKPIYYAQPGARAIAFASEPKALLAAGFASPEPAAGAVGLFLRRGSIPTDASWYRDLRVLPPGHWARWDGRTVATTRYWRVGAHEGAAAAVPVGQAAASVEPALVASVQAHLVSDVPVGIFLSGGLDSTAALAAARRVHDGPLRTFTVAFPGTRFDEGGLAREAAARFGTDHTEIAISGDRFFAEMDRFFASMDEPTVDGANTYLVAQAAREAGLKVVLSGLGADELLGGYDSFVQVPRLRRLVARLDRLPGARAAAAFTAARLPTRAAPKLAEILGGRSADLVDLWRDYRALFSREHVSALAGHAAAANGAGAANEPRETGDWFWDVARCEVEEFMSPQLLRDSDAFTMAWGLELRMPFVDHQLLATVRDGGRWARARGVSYKATLFGHMPGLLPASHLGRPKQGFVLPLEDWLRTALDGQGRATRDDALARVVADPRARRVVEQFRRGRLHWSRVWALYVLERFTRGRGAPVGT